MAYCMRQAYLSDSAISSSCDEPAQVKLSLIYASSVAASSAVALSSVEILSALVLADSSDGLKALEVASVVIVQEFRVAKCDGASLMPSSPGLSDF